MSNIPNKITAIVAGVIFLASAIAYTYFFILEEIWTIGTWRLPVSLSLYLGGLAVLVVLVLPLVVKRIDPDFLYGYRFELILLATCLLALSIALLKNRIA